MTLSIQSSLILLALTTLKNETFHQHTNADISMCSSGLQVSVEISHLTLCGIKNFIFHTCKPSKNMEILPFVCRRKTSFLAPANHLKTWRYRRCMGIKSLIFVGYGA